MKNDNIKEVNSDYDFEDDDLEDQEEEEKYEPDIEDYYDFCLQRSIMKDEQRHLDWLYDTK